MPVRPLRPADLVSLASFHRRSAETTLTSHAWPKVEPESGRLPYLTLTSMALTQQRVAGRRAWLASAGRELQAFVVARARANGLAWDIEHLHALPDHTAQAVDLLEQVIAYAGSAGARRVFLDTPAGTRGQDLARRARFERYTAESLYVLRPPFKPERTDLFEARPRLRADEQALFQLYLAAAPPTVRAAEALTLEEWAGLHCGRRAWKPSFGGEHQHFVWELGANVAGWMKLTFGQRSQFVELLVHPRYDEATDRFLRYVLLQVSPKAPVYVTAREYQPALASALERAGFQRHSTADLSVRLLAARVRQPLLFPAKVMST